MPVQAHFGFKSSTCVLYLRSYAGKPYQDIPHLAAILEVLGKFADPLIRSGDSISLSALNDAGLSLVKLADIIEYEPDGLMWRPDEEQRFEEVGEPCC